MSVSGVSNSRVSRARTEVSTVRLENGSATLLDGVALNADAALRTLDIDTRFNWQVLMLEVSLAHTAATTLTVEVYGKLSEGAPFARTQGFSLEDGTLTASDVLLTKAVSDDIEALFPINVEGLWAVRLVLGGAGAGSSDTVDVFANLVAGA